MKKVIRFLLIVSLAMGVFMIGNTTQTQAASRRTIPVAMRGNWYLTKKTGLSVKKTSMVGLHHTVMERTYGKYMVFKYYYKGSYSLSDTRWGFGFFFKLVNVKGKNGKNYKASAMWGQGPEAQLYYKKLNKNERHSLSWRKTIKLMNGQKNF
ncbi:MULTISPECIES: DUF2715 domain-containing protein [Pediococcus]|uniref:DUF2715 domain-containing protein n=1 Tax=Pediococcus TaxID=1253 RepID=UPI000E933C0E|nr:MULTISPECIES: DUF2715 domain-containing protein [Pediococcus]MCT3029612.1 hypothetical protein [Pediococcus parvulus]HBO46883.1 hypothetical protein [Pediococcus sp.]